VQTQAQEPGLVAGDNVRIALSPGDDEWTVTERLPRRNVLCAPTAAGAANRSPRTSTSSAWSSRRVRPVIPSSSTATLRCVLCRHRRAGGRQQAGSSCRRRRPVVRRALPRLGLPVVTVSAHTRAGLDALIERLKGAAAYSPGSPRRQVVAAQRARGEALRATGALSQGSVKAAIRRSPQRSCVRRGARLPTRGRARLRPPSCR